MPGIVIDPEADIAEVGADVVDPVGDDLAQFLILEIVGVDLDRLALRPLVAAASSRTCRTSRDTGAPNEMRKAPPSSAGCWFPSTASATAPRLTQSECFWSLRSERKAPKRVFGLSPDSRGSFDIDEPGAGLSSVIVLFVCCFEKIVHSLKEQRSRQLWRPRLPFFHPAGGRDGASFEWRENDAEALANLLPAPSDDMQSFGRGRQTIGVLVLAE